MTKIIAFAVQYVVLLKSDLDVQQMDPWTVKIAFSLKLFGLSVFGFDLLINDK